MNGYLKLILVYIIEEMQWNFNLLVDLLLNHLLINQKQIFYHIKVIWFVQ